MHPPLKPAKSFSKRQPLQQIQHNKTLCQETDNTAQVTTKFRSSAENEDENHDEHDLVKQTRNLKIGWNKCDGSNKGILLANIVSGNYQNSQKNNENFNQSHQNSRNNYNNSSRNYSQENLAPNKVKYSRVGAGNHISNNNPRYLQSSQYHTANHYENSRYNLNNRRNGTSQTNDQIDKTDLRYTAKYWTASENDNKKTENIENTFKQVQEEGTNQSNAPKAPSDSSNVENIKNQTRQKPPLRASTNQKPPSHKPTRKSVAPNGSSQRYNQKPHRNYSNYTHNSQTSETNEEQPTRNPKNTLQGIDLRNHASVVIVDYLPESAVTTRHSSDDSNGNHSDDDENEVTEENDGFQQVMTKKKKKAEKLKAAAAAENLVNRNKKIHLINSGNRRVALNNDSRTKYGNNRASRGYDKAQRKTKTEKSNRIYESTSTYSSTSSGSTSPSSSTTKSTKPDETSIELKDKKSHECQRYNQVVLDSQNKQTAAAARATTVNKQALSSCNKVILIAQQERDTISPSLDLNLKIASCKAVWENPNKLNDDTNHHSLDSIKKTEKTELTITETVLKDVLEPLMKQTNEPLVNGCYEKDPIKTQTDSMGGSSVFSGFSKQANLLAPAQKNSLNESHSSSLSQSSNNHVNNIEPFFETASFNNKTEPNEVKIPEPTLEPCLNTMKTTDFNFQSCSHAYPLSSSANNLVRSIIIDNVPPSPSPSVSSYASVPSMSNNNSFHPNLASNIPPVQSNHVIQSHYAPFSNSLAQQDYVQNVQHDQMTYPLMQNQFNYNQQHMVGQAFTNNAAQPFLEQPQNMHQQSFDMQQMTSFDQQPIIQNHNEFYQHTGNNHSEFEPIMNNMSYQQQQIHNSIPFNPFNSNPFNQPQMNTVNNSLNDSNNIQHLPKNGTSPSFQQHQNFPKQLSSSSSNSNLYSLFSSSNNNIMPNPYNFGPNKNTPQQTFDTGFHQQPQTMTPSNSTGSINYLMQFNQPQTHNSPDYLMKNHDQQGNNNSLSRPSSFNNLTKNTGLFDRLPSFDNGKISKSYSNNQQIYYENQNMCTAAPAVQMQANMQNYYLNSNMMNRNNAASNHQMPLNETANYHVNFSNDPNQYHCRQPNGYNQFNVQYHTKEEHNYLPSQPSLLNQPNYQSPLLPQPPHFPMQNRTTIVNNPYNRFKKYPPYHNNNSISNNRQNVNSKCFNTQRRAMTNFHTNNQSSVIKKNDLCSKSYQTSQKSSSPPKPVQKFTILPKPKNTTPPESKKNDESLKK